jgi:hypothetical protein
MRKLMGLALLAATANAGAQQVVDDFESGTNPNDWGWAVSTSSTASIVMTGGNPGAWDDSGVPFMSDHPNFTAVPPAGSPLQTALASGSLHTVSIDMQRIDGSGVEGCFPINTASGFFSIELMDLHSAASLVEAHMTSGPTFPDGPFPWLTAHFSIPSDATDTPEGWKLNADPDLHYTWAELMHNIDGIRVFLGDPGARTIPYCSHLGVDNVVVTYGTDGDTIFADGFDGAATP